MSIKTPVILQDLAAVSDFYTYAQDKILQDDRIEDIIVCENIITGEDFYRIELSSAIFQKCMFTNCNFLKGSFVDVKFAACDFSNCNFEETYFDRCRFEECKCMGINLSESVIKNTLFKESGLQYAVFDKSKITDSGFCNVDFTEGSFSEVNLKGFTAKDCNFIKSNFFKTSLKNIDFSSSELILPILSSPPEELRGSIISPNQALDLIELWGIKVKNT